MKKVIYIWLVSFFSRIKRQQDPQEIVYLMSFGGNNELIEKIAAVAEQSGKKFTVLYLHQCRQAAEELRKKEICTIEFAEGFAFLFNQLQIVMCAKLLLCDNYFAFLSGCAIDHQKTHVVQLWHANGAIKTFGWEELTTAKRSASDKKRFQKVYDQFDEYLVGSRKMAEVFVASYHALPQRMNVIGYPRTDILFDTKWRIQTQAAIYANYPELKDQEVILYAPTYREDQNGQPTMNLPHDFVDLTRSLKQNQKLIIKLHPHLKVEEQRLKIVLKNQANVVWVDDFSTNQLLVITDRLITDYSSVIFDYTLLPNANQILFYCYDYDQYAKQVGIQTDFREWIPGKMVQTTKQLADELKLSLQKSDFTSFNQLWNTANDGHATERVLQAETKYIKR